MDSMWCVEIYILTAFALVSGHKHIQASEILAKAKLYLNEQDERRDLIFASQLYALWTGNHYDEAYRLLDSLNPASNDLAYIDSKHAINHHWKQLLPIYQKCSSSFLHYFQLVGVHGLEMLLENVGVK